MQTLPVLHVDMPRERLLGLVQMTLVGLWFEVYELVSCGFKETRVRWCSH